MKGLVAAIRFITVLPVGHSGTYDPAGMIPFFPIVGLLLGAILSGFDHLVLGWWPQPTTALLEVLLLVGLTGALHLDGLGDTADGLYGYHSREKALAIMKDSRSGAMGVVAIVCGLAAKWAGLMAITDHRPLLLLLVPAYARGAMLFGIRLLPYGRPEGGTGRGLFDRPLPLSAFWGLLPLAGLSLLLGWRAWLLNGGFILLTGILLLFYRRRLGCITGDLLGAAVEVLEAGLFILVAMGGVP